MIIRRTIRITATPLMGASAFTADGVATEIMDIEAMNTSKATAADFMVAVDFVAAAMDTAKR